MSETTNLVIDILLVEDHAVVREGLRLLIEKEPDMRVVGEASDVAGAIRSAVEPNIVVADLVLPDKSGPDAVSALSQRFSNSKILVVTVVDSPVKVHLCFLAGARGYILKEVAVANLIEAIRKVNAGDQIIDPSLGEEVAEAARAASLRSRKPVAYRLTHKELQLVRLLALGYTNLEAAASLGVSLRTVEARRSQIMSKLGLQSRAELIRWATERNVSDPG